MQKLVLAILVISATALAGCSGGGGGDSSDTTTTVPPTTTTTKPGKPTTTTTPVTPNIAPTVKLTVTDAIGGTVTNVTLVDGELWFDATGTADPDGTLSEVAIVAFDGNRSYSGSLYSAGAFTPVNFTFDRAGPVSVTVSALDNRNAIGQLTTKVYVNQVMLTTQASPPRFPYPADDPPGGDSFGCAKFEIQPELLDQQFVAEEIVAATNATTFITATYVSGPEVRMLLCEPDPGRAPISPVGEPNAAIRSNPGTIFVTPSGATGYLIRAALTEANPNSDDKVVIEVTTHFEPDTAPPAPAA